MNAWEYCSITDTKQLEAFGDLGWELVSVTSDHTGYRCWMKRPKELIFSSEVYGYRAPISEPPFGLDESEGS